jgi:hypothetical protein
MAVDQNIVDGRILEQRFKRAQARHFVENFRDEVAQFLCIERKAFNQHILRDELLDMPANFLFRDLVQRGEVDLFDQTPMQTHFGVKQLVAEQRAFCRRGSSPLFGPSLRKDCPGNAFERRRFFRR